MAAKAGEAIRKSPESKAGVLEYWFFINLRFFVKNRTPLYSTSKTIGCPFFVSFIKKERFSEIVHNACAFPGIIPVGDTMESKRDPDEKFVQLVVDHQPALHAFVAALLPGHPDVKDVVQDTNAAIWKKREEFQLGTNFKAWCFSVAKFKVMAVWRDQQRRKVWAVPKETLERLVNEAVEGCFEAEDLRAGALRECIQQLRPLDRGLILNRYFEGQTLKEVAAEVGRKADNLKGSLHRIRLVLRTCMERKVRSRKAMQ
jgi:RNA polymerase sigma-70 factor (ECF subfamily)